MKKVMTSQVMAWPRPTDVVYASESNPMMAQAVNSARSQRRMVLLSLAFSVAIWTSGMQTSPGSAPPDTSSFGRPPRRQHYCDATIVQQLIKPAIASYSDGQQCEDVWPVELP